MAKKPNTVGGGARTNLNGLAFEGRTDLLEALNKHPSIKIIDNNVYKDDELFGTYYEKHGLYKNLLSQHEINYKDILSKKLLPDGALLIGDTLYIIEKKYQSGSGSVDEKLQTCDFKKKQYTKLLKKINIKVEYIYILNSWFDNPSNKDVFEYIESVGCKYFIEELPFITLGIE